MAGAERGAVHLAPAQLHVHRRTGLVVAGDRAAADRLVDEGRGVEPQHLLVRRKCGQRVHAEIAGVALPVTWIVSVRLLAPILILPLAVFTLAVPPVSVRELGLQFGQRRNFADAGAERDRQRRICADRDRHRLTLRRRRSASADWSDRWCRPRGRARSAAIGDVLAMSIAVSDDDALQHEMVRCRRASPPACRAATCRPSRSRLPGAKPIAVKRRGVAGERHRVGQRRTHDELAADDLTPRYRRRRRPAPASAALILVATCAAVSVDEDRADRDRDAAVEAGRLDR